MTLPKKWACVSGFSWTPAASSDRGCPSRHHPLDGQADRPGIIMAAQSFGSGLKSHVHFHILVTDGVYFPDGNYFALGFWHQPSLLSELRHSILKSLVARNCLQAETAKLLESWPLDRRILGLCGRPQSAGRGLYPRPHSPPRPRSVRTWLTICSSRPATARSRPIGTTGKQPDQATA
jgi:hypothetical protein